MQDMQMCKNDALAWLNWPKDVRFPTVSMCVFKKVAKEKQREKKKQWWKFAAFHFILLLFSHCHNTRGKCCTHLISWLLCICWGLLSVPVDIIKFQGSLFKVH